MTVPHPSSERGSRWRRTRTLAGGLALAAFGATALVAATPSAQAASTIDLQLLSFNDYHGHVTGDQSGDIDDEPAGGGEYLAAKLAELRTGKTNTFTVAAGDNIGGSPYFSGLFHDEPSVESLNAMGLDISGVGNHEFDEGVEELIRMQEGGCHPVDGCYFAGDPYAGAEFQWLAANVSPAIPELPPYEIVTVEGQEVAFIGMTLEGTAALVAASGIAGYTFENEVDTANALIGDIQADGAEAIFVLLHEGGLPNPIEIDGCSGITGPIVDIAAGLSAEIDGIITGHTHMPYNCMIEDPEGDDRPVTSAADYGRVVTEMNMKLDDVTGEVDRSTFSVVNHPVIQSELTPFGAVTDVIEKWQELADEEGLTPVGTITEDITRGGIEGSDRGVESAAGNLVADAQFEAAVTAGQPVDVAFMNPGGVRSDLVHAESGSEGDGVVTYGEAFTFQPFNNTLYAFPMTGAQILSVLEEQCQPGGESRPVLHLGVSDGFTYEMSLTHKDSVCTDIEISNVMINGAALDEGTTYDVVANNFLADGGDYFDTFGEVAPIDKIDLGTDLDALVEYLTDNSPVAPPSTDRVDETITVLPGSITSLDPARLLETRTGPDDTTVDGEFEGEGRLGPGEEIELVVAGRADIPGDAAAVALNVGAVLPTGDGFLTVYPCDEERPLASSVNFYAGTVVSNAVIAKVAADGTVCIYSSVETDVIADSNGMVPVNGTPTPLQPARILDTRDGDEDQTDDGLFEGEGALEAGAEVELQVTGRGGVADDAEAVVMNLGAVLPEADGYLTVYPCGEDRPLASSVNYFAGQVVSNAVVAKAGTDGKVCIYTSQMTDLIADVNGEVPVDGAPSTLLPARLLDTRDGPDDKTIDGEFEGIGQAAADSEIELEVAGRGGVGDDAGTVILNVAAVYTEADGYLTVYPCGADRPLASNVNYYAGEVIPNAVIAKVGADGKVCIYTSAATDIIADVVGEVIPPTPYRPAAV